MISFKQKMLICFAIVAFLSVSMFVSMPASLSAATYTATVSGTDQQTVKGLGGGFPWPISGCGAPIQNHSLAAQAVVDMGTSVMRIYIHNQDNVFDSNGNVVDTDLADMLVSEIQWAESQGIPYMYTPGWNNLPSSCYSGGHLLQEYEQAQCNAIKNMLDYFGDHGAPMPIMISLTNEPNHVPPYEDVTVSQLQRVVKLLRTTLDNGGYSSMDIGYPEGGQPEKTNMYLGGNGWPDLSSSTLNNAIDAFITHSYYSATSANNGLIDGYNTYGNGRNLWQSEYCYLSNIDAVPGKDFTTGTTERFISDMAYLKVNYWLTWQIWNSNGPAETDVICSGNGDTSMDIPPQYYVFKKIFNNVPPGSKVRKVTSDDPGLQDGNSPWMDMVAFISSSKMVVVFVNPNSTSRSTDVNGLTGTSASVYQIDTNENYGTDMSLISSPSISGGSISNVSLAGNSVTVIVTNGGSSNNPPTCSITSPSDGATFTEGDNITIDANASDSDGSITKVEFYRDGTEIGEDTSSPYSYTWNNVSAGSYSLTAKATDNDGATTTSSTVNITVGTPGGFPVDLMGTTPEEATVSLNVTKPGGVTDATLEMVVYDADNTNEGVLEINGSANSITLFGSQGTSANDQITVTVSYDTPASWWNDGDNSLRFTHTSTAGYIVESASVTFSGGNEYFVQDSGSDGIVSMEAENYDGNVSQGGHDWVSVTSPSGYSGSSAMRAEPKDGTNNNTGYETNSPRLDYDINFVKTGTHYVWLRVLKTDDADDSYHVGFDGSAVSTADRIQAVGSYNVWNWTGDDMDGGRVRINVSSTGVHTLNIWMREAGARVDKIVMTTNSGYTPSGTGPSESSRGGS